MADEIDISIVVLTYNRNELLRTQLEQLSKHSDQKTEIIVVDNCSTTPSSDLAGSFPEVRFIRNGANLGAAGRNAGIEAANGSVVVCLDDDVTGFSSTDISHIRSTFADESLGALCFRVVEAETNNLTNWVHHRPPEDWSRVSFETYEITEGAVALRRSVTLNAGGFPASFFLSHEGPDLGFRIMNRGFRICYDPSIEVTHSYSPISRTSWRNYYFDTRNTFWLVFRNCPPLFGAKLLLRQTLGMLAYSIRDGYFKWWLKGTFDGLVGIPQSIREREPLKKQVMKKILELEKHRPGLVELIKSRLFQRGVKI